MYRYYHGRPKKLIDRIKYKYLECNIENKVFTIFIIILVVVSIIVGICT